MAGRMDERGYVENGNPRPREPFADRDYDQEPRRMMRGNRRRPDKDELRDPPREYPREFDREFEREGPADDRRYSARRREPLPRPMSSTLSDAFVSAFERGAQMFGENLRMYQDETVRFVTERLEHDTHLFEQLGQSRSMFDLLSLQQRWLSATTRAYSEEWMRLSRLANGAAQRSAGEARQSLNETRRAAYDAE